MSWQIIEMGMARDVEAKIKSDVAKAAPLSEPEQSVRRIMASAIEKILETYPDHYGVQVKVRGSQMPAWDFSTAKQCSTVANLFVEIAPMPGLSITAEGFPIRKKKEFR